MIAVCSVCGENFRPKYLNDKMCQACRIETYEPESFAKARSSMTDLVMHAEDYTEDEYYEAVERIMKGLTKV